MTQTQQNPILSHVTMEQLNPKTCAVYENTQTIIEKLTAARDRGSKLVVMTELAVTGYCVSDLLEDVDFLEVNKEALDKIAPATKGIIAVVGFIDYDPNSLQEDGRMTKYNAAAVFCDGKLERIVHKQLLPNYRYFDDKRFFTKGEPTSPIEVTLNGESLSLGVVICEDLWDQHYKDKPVKSLTDQGAEIILCINASPTYPGKFEVRDSIIREHIAAAQVPVVYTNTVGAADIGKTIICFDGESLAYNASGNLVAKGKKFAAESIDVDLLSSETVKNPEMLREQHLFEGLVMSLKDYADKSGFKKAVVPVSGGIDSALGLAIAVAAFGAENVKAYNLPSKYNTGETKEIAEKLAANFGVEYKIIPIQKIDDDIRAEFEANNHPITAKVAKENIHARIRGLLMMLESNDQGSLLISCGNKTEIALGYCTLYGDMCGGVSVLGDLDKYRDIYGVSRYVNQRYGREMIPEATFKLKPSAELSEGQYDPFDYSVVSPLVDDFIIGRMSPAALIKKFQDGTINWAPDSEGKTVYDKHTVETFSALVKSTYRQFVTPVHKRLQGAPIISVTERTFGFDLREPLINGWRGKQ